MKKLTVFLILFISIFVFSSDFYIVEKGDNLSQIAINEGITLNKLIEYNDLDDANYIYEGQQLRLIPPYTQKDLNEQAVLAILWYQTSGEFKALSYQAFNLARMLFDKDMEINPDDTATPAVIVDIDETVLNNIPWEAGLIGTDKGYPEDFLQWIVSRSAEPQPGAVEFLNYVVDNGGEVFYISNRLEATKLMTIDNLNRFGFPLADKEHVLLATDTMDKEPRREIVEKDYRIVVLMGDNLNDFSSIFKNVNIEDRNSSVDQLKELWGTKFVVMPNPIYGDWEEAVYGWTWSVTPEEKDKVRKENLIKWNQ